MDANIVMPHPSYYNLGGAVPMTVPVVNGVAYTPMASATDMLQRLCTPGDVMATFAGEDAEAAITNGVMNLRLLCERGIAMRKRILFLGEYICDLSYVCLM